MWNLYYEEEENLSAEILEVNIPRSAFYPTSTFSAQKKIREYNLSQTLFPNMEVLMNQTFFITNIRLLMFFRAELIQPYSYMEKEIKRGKFRDNQLREDFRSFLFPLLLYFSRLHISLLSSAQKKIRGAQLFTSSSPLK